MYNLKYLIFTFRTVSCKTTYISRIAQISLLNIYK